MTDSFFIVLNWEHGLALVNLETFCIFLNNAILHCTIYFSLFQILLPILKFSMPIYLLPGTRLLSAQRMPCLLIESSLIPQWNNEKESQKDGIIVLLFSNHLSNHLDLGDKWGSYLTLSMMPICLFLAPLKDRVKLLSRYILALPVKCISICLLDPPEEKVL